MSAFQYLYNLPVFLGPKGCSHAPVLYTTDFEHLRCPPITRDVRICGLVGPPPYEDHNGCGHVPTLYTFESGCLRRSPLTRDVDI